MSDATKKFIDFLQRNGIQPESPSQIKADDQVHRFRVAGDKRDNATYRLKVNGDMAVGWVHYFKMGETLTFSSRPSRNMTQEEKQEHNRRVAEEKRRKQEEIKRQQDEAANEARRLVNASKPAGSHQYITDKKLDNLPKQDKDGSLVIPMYKDGQLRNVQMIDGDKRFLKGGEVNGCYYPIVTKQDDKSVILICEGYATGDTLRKATGYPVAVAFNAGNLKHVAETMREKYPDARLIIAGDNDQWSTDAKGNYHNAGVEKAKQAAAACGGFAIWPDVPGDDPDQRTDFKDIELSDGIEQVKDTLDPVLSGDSALDASDVDDSDSPPLPPLEAYSDEVAHEVALYESQTPEEENKSWREELTYNQDGQLVSNSLNNAMLIMENDPVFTRMFCFDEFAQEKVVVQCPPWETPSRFKPRQVMEHDYVHIARLLEKRGVKPQFSLVPKLVSTSIMNRCRHPAREYFRKLEWDGEPRLDRWLIDYAGAVYDDEEYVKAVGRKWMTAAVSRIFEPGCKFDHMLILEGDQSVGKSYLLRELATIHGREYFDDSMNFVDLVNEKKPLNLQGVLIIEFQELAGFNKLSPSQRKAAMTIQHDRIRRPYDKELTDLPRQCVFGGTINPDQRGYLDDVTGERRFWPVRVDSVDLTSLRRDKEQLWAEAVHRYNEGEPLYLNDEQETKLEQAQETRKAIDAWMPYIEEEVGTKPEVTQDQLWQAIGMDKSRIGKQDQDRINDIMVRLGYKYRRKRVGGKRRYVWEYVGTDQEEREIGF
jgi:putative DNA primase/helicase